MTLITLNLWGGKVFQPLMDFIKRYGPIADIFCFQEVFHNGHAEPSQKEMRMTIFNELTKALRHHTGYFSWAQSPAQVGLAMFVKNAIPLEQHDDFYVYQWNAEDQIPAKKRDRKLQYMRLRNDEGIMIANFHGLYTGINKEDTSQRLVQSKKIHDFLATVNGAKILAGDFNLLPTTKSIAMLEEGMKNLVTEYGITSTRTPLYRHYNDAPRFADYILVSPDITVVRFEVLPNIVSDHSPLLLEFK